jgi:hypothetical protein
MKKIKKPSEHQIGVTLNWLVIINAFSAALADVISDYVMPGWPWALVVVACCFTNLLHLDRIKDLEELAESGRRLCVATEELIQHAIKQRSIIQAQDEEIKRLKGEQEVLR